MELTLDRFLELFPEFEASDLTKLESTILQATVETNGYCGVSPVATQELALGLRVAHFTKVSEMIAAGDPCNTGATNVKRYKSNNDEVEFYQNKDPYALANTSYGVRLQSLVLANTGVGIGVWGFCGC